VFLKSATIQSLQLYAYVCRTLNVMTLDISEKLDLLLENFKAARFAETYIVFIYWNINVN